MNNNFDDSGIDLNDKPPRKIKYDKSAIKPSAKDEMVDFTVNLGNKSKTKKNKELTKLIEADKLHLKKHPSPDDKMELEEDKTKLKLLKYIDTKWFDDPEYIKIKKVKLLKNRVIKKIKSGEFTHKKEVNKYIKDYNAKNFKSDKYI